MLRADLDLRDAGPGVGVSNYEVRFRDDEMARIRDSDYRLRCHRSRGDSGQGETERTNSDIADGLVDGATLECDRFKRFGDPSAEEARLCMITKNTKKERMAKSAWYTCSQVSERIHDAPVLREYIQSRVSEPPNSQVHKNPKCETHGHFCLIFGNIAIFY